MDRPQMAEAWRRHYGATGRDEALVQVREHVDRLRKGMAALGVSRPVTAQGFNRRSLN
ncbi:hypothetical protein LCGC14_2358650, partial [marine sediment metagenome]